MKVKSKIAFYNSDVGMVLRNQVIDVPDEAAFRLVYAELAELVPEEFKKEAKKTTKTKKA